MSEPYSGTIHDPGAAPPPPPHVRARTFTFGSGAARAGLTMGSTLAMVISWDVNHSVPWAIIHGFLSWGYVIYHLLTHP